YRLRPRGDLRKLVGRAGTRGRGALAPARSEGAPVARRSLRSAGVLGRTPFSVFEAERAGGSLLRVSAAHVPAGTGGFSRTLSRWLESPLCQQRRRQPGHLPPARRGSEPDQPDEGLARGGHAAGLLPFRRPHRVPL